MDAIFKKPYLGPFPTGMIFPLFAGWAMGLSLIYPRLAPLQLPALTVLALVLVGAGGVVARLRPGLWFGAALAVSVLLVTGIPMAATLILFGALSLYWMTMGFALAWFLRRGGVPGWAGAVALVTLGEWAQPYAVPLFGTAQRFASAWVEYDATLMLSRVGGTTLVTAFVAALAFGHAVRGTLGGRAKAGVALAAVAVVASGHFVAHQILREAPRAVVAVAGSPEVEVADLEDFLARYEPMAAAAAKSGATVFVTPELALFTIDSEREAMKRRVESVAKRLGLTWIAGFSNAGPKANRAVILNTRSGCAEYDKTHWVPFMEAYERHGDGAAIVAETPAGVRCGVMICQDDNFEDVARAQSLAGARLVGVPTLDWPGVASAHLHSARNRPREYGYAEARGAIGGISAIIDPTGRVVASRNHVEKKDQLWVDAGGGMVAAEVPLGNGEPTLFASGGWWAVPAAMAMILGLAAWLIRKSDSREELEK